MAIDNFIPTLWAGALLASLKKRTIYAQAPIVNRNYQGEITQRGDTVKITSIGAITVGDYTAHTDIAFEELTDTEQSLVIDQQKYFAFELDDVEKAQAQNSGGVMSQAMTEAAYALSDVRDQFVAGLYTGVAAGNNLGTIAVTTGDDAYDTLVALRTTLDEADVPHDGRYAVIPPWYEGLLLDNSKFTSLADYGSTRAIRNGEVGEAAGFSLLKSNNVPNPAGDDFVVQAGYPGAVTFAEQVAQTEAVRLEKRFADGVKGLHLYGSKLVRSTGIAIATASKT